MQNRFYFENILRGKHFVLIHTFLFFFFKTRIPIVLYNYLFTAMVPMHQDCTGTYAERIRGLYAYFSNVQYICITEKISQ